MMRLHPGVLCVAFCTGCSRCWHGWLCARDARRTLRSLCCATRSQSCTDRTTGQRSRRRTGPCWVRSRRPCRDRSDLAGSSHQRPCCAGIDAESPATGPDPAGRPCTSVELRRLIIEMATNNPTWGYRRITGEPLGLGHRVGASTVWRILKQAGVDPAPQRTSVTWTQFLRSQGAVACDFVTVDTPCCAAATCCCASTSPPARSSTAPSQPTRPAHGPPKQRATCSCVTHSGSPTPEHFCETAPASSPATSTRSSEPRVSRSCAPRFASQWPTRSPNVGSAPCAESSLTAPSSGTNARSNTSSPATSTTTTPTGPTARSINDPQRRPNRQTPTDNSSFESSQRHAAADSSTNTEEPPDQPRQGFGHPHARCHPGRPCATGPLPAASRAPQGTPCCAQPSKRSSAAGRRTGRLSRRTLDITAPGVPGWVAGRRRTILAPCSASPKGIRRAGHPAGAS